MKTLIIDDNQDIRTAISMILKENGGHEILMAEDGEMAIQILKENGDINLVITDMDMPKMDGLAVLREMKTSGYKAKRWFMSGYISPELEKKALELGADVAVSKAQITQTLREKGIIG